MAYTKQNFKDGQFLKAEHLNHIEDGLFDATEAANNAAVLTSPLIITISTDTSGNMTSDKTFSEILAAHTSGRRVYIEWWTVHYDLIIINTSCALFATTSVSNGWVVTTAIMVSENGTVTLETVEGTFVPVATVENNGQTLKVIDGVWTFADFPTGGGSTEGAILYTEQHLTGDQAAQARKNIGVGSVGTVYNPTIQCDYASVEGYSCDVNMIASHAEGYQTKTKEGGAGQVGAHAEGYGTMATGNGAHAEGRGTMAVGDGAHAEGQANVAASVWAHAEGYRTMATGNGAHVEGCGTEAVGCAQHVQGRFNIPDAVDENGECQYAHIIGNGTDENYPSNAHTVDWDGNAWYSGHVESAAVIIPSPNGTRWMITVNDEGTLTATAVT